MYDIAKRIGVLFHSTVVIIGGREVNLLCEGEERPTNDVDLIVIAKSSTISEQNEWALKAEAIKLGFEMEGITKIFDIRTSTPSGDHVKVDVFYDVRGEIPPGREEMRKVIGGVSGIPSEEVMKNAVRITRAAEGHLVDFRIAAPWQLVLIKYNVMVNEKEAPEQKHGDDIVKVIKHQYGSVDMFLSKEKARIEDYIRRKFIGKNVSGNDMTFTGDCENFEQFVTNLKEIVEASTIPI
ncbi:MAG: hypothetical protein M1504_02620 [Candidatus Marsarchaeota archaeon]|nr:hypothetical protein [Candidatus Marsarchaeota archaeon]